MRSEKILLKRIAESHNCATFVATVHTTLPIRTASQGVSFAFNTLCKENRTSFDTNFSVS